MNKGDNVTLVPCCYLHQLLLALRSLGLFQLALIFYVCRPIAFIVQRRPLTSIVPLC